jgi:hypothetical protein
MVHSFRATVAEAIVLRVSWNEQSPRYRNAHHFRLEKKGRIQKRGKDPPAGVSAPEGDGVLKPVPSCGEWPKIPLIRGDGLADGHSVGVFLGASRALFVGLRWFFRQTFIKWQNLAKICLLSFAIYEILAIGRPQGTVFSIPCWLNSVETTCWN